MGGVKIPPGITLLLDEVETQFKRSKLDNPISQLVTQDNIEIPEATAVCSVSSYPRKQVAIS